ncbi:MAG: DNA recombination/repair protein RecA, partial [Bacilli bacterium]|nr:DNA recombination/repair protein RecA [Bacilli bacterium]
MKKEKDNSVNALDEALKLVEKAYGKGTVMKLGDRPKVDVNVIPSGSLLIDKA